MPTIFPSGFDIFDVLLIGISLVLSVVMITSLKRDVKQQSVRWYECQAMLSSEREHRHRWEIRSHELLAFVNSHGLEYPAAKDWRGGSLTLDISKVDEESVRGILREWFSLEDLEQICVSLGVVWDNLRGDTLTAKASSLTREMRNRGRLPELVEAIRKERPHLFDKAI